MVKPGRFGHLYLVYHLTVPSAASSRTKVVSPTTSTRHSTTHNLNNTYWEYINTNTTYLTGTYHTLTYLYSFARHGTARLEATSLIKFSKKISSHYTIVTL